MVLASVYSNAVPILEISLSFMNELTFSFFCSFPRALSHRTTPYRTKRYGGNAAAAVSLPPGLVGSDPMSPSSRLLPTASMAVLNTAVTVEVVVDDAPLTENVEVRGRVRVRDYG